MNGADVVPEEHAAAARAPGSATHPSGSGRPWPAHGLGNGGRLVVTQGDAVGAAGRADEDRESMAAMGNRACAKLAGSGERHHYRDDLVGGRMKGDDAPGLAQPDIVQRVARRLGPVGRCSPARRSARAQRWAGRWRCNSGAPCGSLFSRLESRRRPGLALPSRISIGSGDSGEACRSHTPRTGRKMSSQSSGIAVPRSQLGLR